MGIQAIIAIEITTFPYVWRVETLEPRARITHQATERCFIRWARAIPEEWRHEYRQARTFGAIKRTIRVLRSNLSARILARHDGVRYTADTA